ncbi:protein of unknown function [Methylacidimicrobium sp. AP8]|uniref:hypothetical protein n=1 Tax=Methylacidimicrobium sp. AP8 TaxID=2730359 RepID=UPI0018C0014C|nr:hypothetical protein [Methylacidimicrobium sp. AP8]CAB4243532.1 protein of unknown function [Methylacidimicrobium sp. AP8]
MPEEARKPEEGHPSPFPPSSPVERELDQFVSRIGEGLSRGAAAAWNELGHWSAAAWKELNHGLESSPERKPEAKTEPPARNPPPAVPTQGQSGPSPAQDAKAAAPDPLLVAMNQKLDQAQKELAELRMRLDELSKKSGPAAEAPERKRHAEKPRQSPDPLPLAGWDEYGIEFPSDPKAYLSHRHSPAHPHSRASADPPAPAHAREALRHLHEASREIGGEAPQEERRLEREFTRLQHRREQFFDQAGRVVKDSAKLQQDQRLHPERAAEDRQRLLHDRQLLGQKREIVEQGSRTLADDAARFGREHPELRKEAGVLAEEARREGRDFPRVPSAPSSTHHRSPVPSHAQKAMEALRARARESHSPACEIVTQAGRHVHIFESSRKELLALHRKYGEDLVRAQRDKALHPEEWKRLRDDRERLERDQAAIRKDERVMGRETHAVGRLAREIGREDPSLREYVRKLKDQVEAENRDARHLVPRVPGSREGRDR